MTTRRLLDLQEADTALGRLQARRRALEDGSELAAVRADADAADNRLGELRLRLDEIGRDQSRFEHEIDSMTQKEQADQQRMYDGSIVNAKELEALQHEIASVHKRRSDREDELVQRGWESLDVGSLTRIWYSPVTVLEPAGEIIDVLVDVLHVATADDIVAAFGAPRDLNGQ